MKRFESTKEVHIKYYEGCKYEATSELKMMESFRIKGFGVYTSEELGDLYKLVEKDGDFDEYDEYLVLFFSNRCDRDVIVFNNSHVDLFVG
jgi:hypothetical protein